MFSMPSSCAKCNKTGATAVCGACKCTYYCSRDCQRKDWKQHKKICKMIKEQGQQKTNTTKRDEKQSYQDRIDRVLEVVQPQREACAQSQVQDIYGLVEKEYENKKGIDGFIEDCGEYVMNIDSIYADNVNKCALDVCACIKREFRDRNVYDKNGKERLKLYSHCEDEKSVVIQQFVDQMHINKYHLTDIGLRYINNN
eukprot:511704_1